MYNRGIRRVVLTSVCVWLAFLTSGCIAQQADLKKAEQQLQSRIKQSNDELAQTRARQSQEISTLREQELPQLRGELERAMHQAQELQGKQEDLKQRSAQLEQQTRRLEQLAGKLDSESSARYNQVRESLNAQDVKNKQDRDQLRLDVNTRLDTVNQQMETLRKEIIDAVQKTNGSLTKSLDARFEEQRKSVSDNQARNEQLSAKFTQFSQSLTAFRESLTSLSERLGQEDQAIKALSEKVDTDTRSSVAHVNDMNKAVTGHLGEVNKSVASVAQKLAARLDEQDHHLAEVNTSVASVAQKLAARLDGQDQRLGEVNTSVASVAQKLAARLDGQDQRLGEVNTSVASVAQKLAARLDEQDQRLALLAKSLDQVAQEAHQRAGNKNGQRPSISKQLQRSALPPPSEPSPGGQEIATISSAQPEASQGISSASATDESEQALRAQTSQSHVSQSSERSDKVEYERLLALFREGNLDGARQGFVAFLHNYPNSDLSPNARFWLGESHYGKHDYKQAIDSYDRVEVDYPQSEKVPAAILKKGYAYLALKDKKRASSAFKQVVTLYPKTPEAGKASDKLTQLKETR